MTGNFQVSAKLNDGRIFVVAGDTFEQFKSNLGSLVGFQDAETVLTSMTSSLMGNPTQTNPYAALDEANARVSAAFPGSTIVNPVPPTSPSANSTSPSGRVCAHGLQMTKREGSGEKGPWKAYMCATPKGTPDQCKAEFIRRGTPEWNNF